jgi:hypothetical protein
MTFLHTQQIKATHKLLELKHDSSSNFLLAQSQNDWKANLFAVCISLHFTIHGGRLSGLRCQQVKKDGTGENEISNAKLCSHLQDP